MFCVITVQKDILVLLSPASTAFNSEFHGVKSCCVNI